MKHASSRLARRATLITATAIAGCGGGDARLLHQAAIIYGADDRREAHQIADPELRTIAEKSLVALTRRTDTLEASPTLASKHRLCPGIRFAEQPAFARCTGILVQPDLVLTAGHCADQLSCAGMSVVRGFHYQQGGELPASQLETFGCKQVLAIDVDPPSEPAQKDYAWVRLDRTAQSTAPVRLSGDDRRSLAGQEVVTAGYPGGLPAKWTRGTVFDAGDQQRHFLVASLDTFHGNSGSPVFGPGNQLVGVLARGDADLVATAAGCNVIATRDENALTAAEEATHVAVAISKLCESGAVVPGICAPPAADSAGGCRLASGSRPSNGLAWPLLLVLALLSGRMVRRSLSYESAATGSASRWRPRAHPLLPR